MRDQLARIENSQAATINHLRMIWSHITGEGPTHFGMPPFASSSTAAYEVVEPTSPVIICNDEDEDEGGTDAVVEVRPPASDVCATAGLCGEEGTGSEGIGRTVDVPGEQVGRQGVQALVTCNQQAVNASPGPDGRPR